MMAWRPLGEKHNIIWANTDLVYRRIHVSLGVETLAKDLYYILIAGMAQFAMNSAYFYITGVWWLWKMLSFV